MKCEQQVELRGMVRKSTVDVIDAWSMSNHQTRTDLVNQILDEWADARLHEVSLVNSVAEGNPALTERLGLRRK
jgi:hypothetical protein